MKDNTGLDSSEDRLGIEIPKEKRYLNTSSYDYSISFLVEMMTQRQPKIILEVPFQRNFIWKTDRASQLIESVIMNVPIPPLYFAEEEDGRWLVLDGLQRLNSLLSFYQNEYPLKGLEVITELATSKYKDLPPKAKSLLDDGLMRVNVIKKDSHPDIKYDIFMRLNKGAVSLNYQELRNCLYRGNLNDCVKDYVAATPMFYRALKLKKPHDRFLDVEFIIRVLALRDKLTRNERGEFVIAGYNGRMVNFINNYMEGTTKMTEVDAIETVENFHELFLKVLTVFGEDRAFKDPTSDALKFNKAIGEIMLLGFERFPIDLLKEKRAKIAALLDDLLDENSSFREAISLRTTDSDVVNLRINVWLNALIDAIPL